MLIIQANLYVVYNNFKMHWVCTSSANEERYSFNLHAVRFV